MNKSIVETLSLCVTVIKRKVRLVSDFRLYENIAHISCFLLKIICTSSVYLILRVVTAIGKAIASQPVQKFIASYTSYSLIVTNKLSGRDVVTSWYSSHFAFFYLMIFINKIYTVLVILWFSHRHCFSGKETTYCVWHVRYFLQ